MSMVYFLKNINKSIKAPVLGQTKVCLTRYPISGSDQKQMPKGNYKNKANLYLVFLNALPAFKHSKLWDFLS